MSPIFLVPISDSLYKVIVVFQEPTATKLFCVEMLDAELEIFCSVNSLPGLKNLLINIQANKIDLELRQDCNNYVVEVYEL